MNHERELWAEEVLASADTIERAKAGAGFYAKTMSRINAEAAVSTTYVLQIAAALLVLITLNVFACVSFSNNKSNGGSEQLQAFAKEYALHNSSDNF
jgi:hypothetical protein